MIHQMKSFIETRFDFLIMIIIKLLLKLNNKILQKLGSQLKKTQSIFQKNVIKLNFI